MKASSKPGLGSIGHILKVTFKDFYPSDNKVGVKENEGEADRLNMENELAQESQSKL